MITGRAAMWMAAAACLSCRLNFTACMPWQPWSVFFCSGFFSQQDRWQQGGAAAAVSQWQKTVKLAAKLSSMIKAFHRM
jgi:hypothetical protein